MTTAPKNLIAVRALLLDHLGAHGLASAEVGIVGDAAHRGGYHCGRNRVDLDDYSVRESPRDRAGLGDDASALDVGTFAVGAYDLRQFSAWLVAQCAAGAPDTADIREVIYSPDGRTVKRWDRLGRRNSGDRSHLTHTHISFFRDATRSGRDLTSVFRRYLNAIGILDGEATLFCAKGDKGTHVQALQVALNYLGFDAGAEDGSYGDATTAAVLRMRRAAGSQTTTGDKYDAWAHVQLQICMARKFGAGAQGPKGDRGPKGDPGPAGEVDYPRLVGALLAEARG
ncbi:peptidoglycan-binding protein [Micromonospora okii]|uniref:peptidoglycan-binding protein n=1 Tax=Micromonospora okii TaxID=1182970 RepID=UPI001E5ABE7D|nr:peptidoglycan-binding protein [Micromonospora okii]